MSQGRLAGKTAIITGAGTGIGECTAKRFAEEGAAVLLTDWNAAGAARVAEEITAAGGRAVAVPGDVRSATDVKNVVDQAIARFGQIDILVNNAGISDRHTAAIRTTDDLWNDVLATNLTGTFNFCREALPHMVAKGAGTIVNVGSIGGVYHNAGVAYSAAKAGVNGLTRNIALQYAGTGIRCNSVNPGPTTTSMFSPEVLAACDKEMQDIAFGHICLSAGLCDPIDQANAILFLASDEARYVTGQWLVIDRGVCL